MRESYFLPMIILLANSESAVFARKALATYDSDEVASRMIEKPTGSKTDGGSIKNTKGVIATRLLCACYVHNLFLVQLLLNFVLPTHDT